MLSSRLVRFNGSCFFKALINYNTILGRRFFPLTAKIAQAEAAELPNAAWALCPGAQPIFAAFCKDNAIYLNLQPLSTIHHCGAVACPGVHRGYSLRERISGGRNCLNYYYLKALRQFSRENHATCEIMNSSLSKMNISVCWIIYNFAVVNNETKK